MSKKKVKIIALIIGIIFTLGIIFPLVSHLVLSAPSAGNSVEQDAQINDLNENIKRLDGEIAETSKRLADVTLQLQAAEAYLADKKSEAGKRFRIMCERGSLSYINIIFSATSLSDFIDRIVIARELYEYDKKVLSSINQVKNEIENDKSEIDALLQSQNTMADELNKNKAELEDVKSRLN